MIFAASNVAMIQLEVNSVDWIKAASDADGGGEKPKRFSMVAYTGGAMQVGYCASPVVIDLSGLTATAPTPILLNHEPDRIVGHADEVDNTGSVLKLSGVVSGASSEASQVVASAALGFPWKASVGARPDKLEFVGAGVSATANGKTFKGPVYIARKATLGEVSFVAMAADGKTSAKVAATAVFSRKESEMDEKLKNWIEALGLVVSELRDDQVEKVTASYKAQVKAAEQKNAIEGKAELAPVVVEPPKFNMADFDKVYAKHSAVVEAKAALYANRIDAPKLAEIRANAEIKATELKVQGLTDEWAAPRLEVELAKAQAAYEQDLIRGERPKAMAIHVSGHDTNPDIIQAALSIPYLQAPEKHFRPEVIDAASRQYRNLGLQETLLLFARSNGYNGRERIHTGNLREVLQAAFSTNTLTTLLSSTGNKILLEGFNAIPQTWRQVAAIRNVSDFKAVTAYRLTADLEYEEVGPAGEIKHGTVGQESYSIQAKTHAKMLTLTRQDIINDDLGAFNDLRNRFAIGQAIKLNKVFWTAFLAASNSGAFWSAERGNLVTGSPLGEAGLNTAVQAFRDIKGPDGNMMSLDPKFVLVPSALEATARKWYSSQEMRDTTASTKFATSNIYQNMFVPIVVPELGNSSYTGYSPTSWHLLADPRVLACAVVCFLNGQESPTIESAEADFDVLGVQFRGYHDFGASMSEYRASVKATA
jgi:hypothetical protein